MNKEIINFLYDVPTRQRLLKDPKKFLDEIGEKSMKNIEIKVVRNTADTIHFIMPGQISKLDDGYLQTLSAAGGKTSTIGCAGTASSVSSITSSVGSASSAGSLGSVSSIDS